MSDSELETSSASIIEISHDSHLPPLGQNHLELEIVPLSEDFDLERVFGNSSEEETSSSSS